MQQTNRWTGRKGDSYRSKQTMIGGGIITGDITDTLYQDRRTFTATEVKQITQN